MRNKDDRNIGVNAYIREIREYAVASQAVWNAESVERENMIKIDWNESTILPSPKVDAAIKLLVDEKIYNLYPNTKNETLIKALSEYTELPAENIQYFASSDALHEYICRVYLREYTRVLILSPSYDNFRLTAESFGAEIIYSDLNENFAFNPTLYEKDLDNYHPKMAYICNPNNPSGTQHDVSYIEYLIDKYRNIIFLIDEAYWEFSGITVANLVRKYNNLLVSRTFSKAFGLANFRIGYLVADAEIISTINKVRNPKNITSFAQQAAIAALADTDYMWNYVKEVKKAKELFIDAISEMKNLGRPITGEGNFVLFQCNNSLVKSSLINYLEQNNVFIRDITQHPLTQNCVRFSIGNTEQMNKVAYLMKKMCQEIIL